MQGIEEGGRDFVRFPVDFLVVRWVLLPPLVPRPFFFCLLSTRGIKFMLCRVSITTGDPIYPHANTLTSYGTYKFGSVVR